MLSWAIPVNPQVVTENPIMIMYSITYCYDRTNINAEDVVAPTDYSYIYTALLYENTYYFADGSGRWMDGVGGSNTAWWRLKYSRWSFLGNARRNEMNCLTIPGRSRLCQKSSIRNHRDSSAEPWLPPTAATCRCWRRLETIFTINPVHIQCSCMLSTRHIRWISHLYIF